GVLSPINYALHSSVADAVISLVRQRLVQAIHDVSDGGIGVALAEMAIAGGVGFTASDIAGHQELFSESPSRVIICVAQQAAASVERFVSELGVPIRTIGTVGGDRIAIRGLVSIPLMSARDAWSSVNIAV
ncbi:MAG TPA: AIR synthase-related protein, partial [Acidimicrobiales bacterium]|nr:AIR synthase-related protein [Acidimicrobiales bacterium]